MSISTGTGDEGRTNLLFDRRVAKHDVRLEAYGTIDELTAFLGLAKAECESLPLRELVHSVQYDLFIVGSELATVPEDAERLELRITAERVERLQGQIDRLEDELNLEECCFLIPGGNRLSALFDVCRTVARRAERLAWRLREEGWAENRSVLVYLNRLSDLLWLLARAEEAEHSPFRCEDASAEG